ncbi:hypothetical protein C7R54_01120 [Achromobacter aloeverae]|uniref:Uncharacterized protein n=1 Tax=Achromobacter aloeverae TaxID=1750518 RepID=A0A4Q1HNB4_9BURK|nr:hypothetical protein C7R54_01120 [Achromobacter aloeverae]
MMVVVMMIIVMVVVIVVMIVVVVVIIVMMIVVMVPIIVVPIIVVIAATAAAMLVRPATTMLARIAAMLVGRAAAMLVRIAAVLGRRAAPMLVGTVALFAGAAPLPDRSRAMLALAIMSPAAGKRRIVRCIHGRRVAAREILRPRAALHMRLEVMCPLVGGCAPLEATLEASPVEAATLEPPAVRSGHGP